MPIYAYRCGACGHAKDVLQKLSDPVLTTCPACGAEAFTKQVTAAGFQLKGSGWYVTDFRGGTSGAPAQADDAKSEKADPSAKADKPADGAAAPAGSTGATAPTAAPATPAAPAPAAPGSGGG